MFASDDTGQQRKCLNVFDCQYVLDLFFLRGEE